MSTIGPVIIGPAITPPSESGADPPDGGGSAFSALLAASQAQAGGKVNGTGIPPDPESAEGGGDTLDHHVEANPKTGSASATTDAAVGHAARGREGRGDRGCGCERRWRGRSQRRRRWRRQRGNNGARRG